MRRPQVIASAFREWRGILAKMDLAEVDSGQEAVASGDVDALNTTDLESFVRLLELAGDASAKHGLSWGVGLASDYATRGKIGRAVIGAKTLGAGLRRLESYYPLVQEATLLRLEIEDDWATLSYKILDPDIWPRQQDALYSLGLYANLIRIAALDVWGHVEITVEAEKEMIRSDLSRIVDTAVCYGGASNILRFPASALSAPLALAPPAELRLLDELSRTLDQKKRAALVSERVRDLIFSDMCEGRATQENVAAALGMSTRTLRRRLAAENTSFRDLHDDCRMRAAAFEFRTRDVVSLSELAFKLGYSEHSTFTRAFSRWSGMAPKDYRRTVTLH